MKRQRTRSAAYRLRRIQRQSARNTYNQMEVLATLAQMPPHMLRHKVVKAALDAIASGAAPTQSAEP
jgi:hypothetical protein